MNMKSIGILSISLITLLTLLSSCQFTPNEEGLPINLDSNKIHTLIFSSETNKDEERKYYDALLTVKKRYPNKLDSIQIIQKRKP